MQRDDPEILSLFRADPRVAAAELESTGSLLCLHTLVFPTRILCLDTISKLRRSRYSPTCDLLHLPAKLPFLFLLSTS